MSQLPSKSSVARRHQRRAYLKRLKDRQAAAEEAMRRAFQQRRDERTIW